MLNTDIKVMELISKDGKSKEEVKEFIIKIIETMGFTGALNEIKGNRNSLKNALYAVNTFCNNKLDKRYDVATRECVWQPSEEKIKQVEYFRMELIDLCNYALTFNTELETEYLRLKNEYSNATFQIAQYYKELDLIEDREEYLNKSKGIELLQKKLNDSENKLDLYVMKNFK